MRRRVSKTGWGRLSSFFFWSLAAIGGVVVVLTQTPLVSWAARPLVVYAPLEKADAIVVLGGGVRPDGVLTDATQRRLVYALRLLRGGYAPIVILTGGNPEDPDLSESDPMERVARELGFSPGTFIVETKAERTSEQALAVREIVRSRQMKSVILVTAPTHSFRALQTFRKAGVPVIVGTIDPALKAPTKPTPWWKRWVTLNLGIILGRLNLTGLVLYEYVALTLYWWNGWI
jgi:uncharacterized SAM-binding protein YcdF (DUF218 family)